MRIPGPTDFLKIAGQGYEAAERAIALVPRVVVVLGQVEKIVGQVTTMIAELELTQRRASALVTRTGLLTDSLASLVERFAPALDRLEPTVTRLADTTSTAEVDAVVQLVNTLPEISEKVRADILPILDTLGTVAPDLRDLLDVSKELNEMLGSVPGMGRVKKRIEERQEDEDAERSDEYRASETPPAAPDRQPAQRSYD